MATTTPMMAIRPTAPPTIPPIIAVLVLASEEAVAGGVADKEGSAIQISLLVLNKTLTSRSRRNTSSAWVVDKVTAERPEIESILGKSWVAGNDFVV